MTKTSKKPTVVKRDPEQKLIKKTQKSTYNVLKYSVGGRVIDFDGVSFIITQKTD